jgi:dihydroneopterin aldolase
MTDRIHLAGMVFLSHVGAGDDERADAQEIEVDVVLELDLEPAGASDDLAQTINYSRLFDACREIVEQGSFHLLEAVATSIAARVLVDFGAVDALTVRVRKPGVPIDGRLDYAGVEIERRRHGA